MVSEISSATDRSFCHFGQYFAYLHPKNPKNENFEKNLEIPGDIIILHKCTKNHDNMIYCSCDMLHYRCTYFSFWAIFCPFTPIKARKMEMLKKRKKHLEILSFYASVPKIRVIRYTIPETWRVTDVIVIFHFGLFFPLLPP